MESSKPFTFPKYAITIKSRDVFYKKGCPGNAHQFTHLNTDNKSYLSSKIIQITIPVLYLLILFYHSRGVALLALFHKWTNWGPDINSNVQTKLFNIISSIALLSSSCMPAARWPGIKTFRWEHPFQELQKLKDKHMSCIHAGKDMEIHYL